MVKYYKTNKNYYFKIVKNKKIRISKEEYLKNNKKKGGAYNSQSLRAQQYAQQYAQAQQYHVDQQIHTVPNHMGWVIALHGKTIPPSQSPHIEIGQEFPQLPLNVALYLYTPLSTSLSSSASLMKKTLGRLCRVACNPDPNGSQMRSIANQKYKISKVEPGSFFYDMYLGGPREWVPKETYGFFRCDKDNNFNPIQLLDYPENFTTLGYLISYILKSFPNFNHSIHIYSCRDRIEKSHSQWNKNNMLANSFNLPFKGELPNEYTPPGKKRGY